jgi:hypothetical protein
VRPKKKRLTKRFNPIRGFYELETNIPHVYQSTQPTSIIEMYREDVGAHIFPEEDTKEKGKRKSRQTNGSGGGREGVSEEGEEREKRRKLELAASTKGGIASLELVSFEKGWNLEEPEFSREPLIPGMWDFGAGPHAVLQDVEEQ